MPFYSYKERSRQDFGIVKDDPGLNSDELKTGALLRIADATEAMAKEYQKLISERDYYKRRLEEEKQHSKRLLRSNAALRGEITKLKNKC